MFPPVALSRRRFLQFAAAASAAAAVPRVGWAAVSDEVFDDGGPSIPGGSVGDPERVIIIGSGFAGLAAANALANAGVEVTVLEARARIGGRAQTREVGGILVDQGCSWIHGPVGNPMARWAGQLGVGATTADFEDDLFTFTAFDQLTGPLSTAEFLPPFFQTALFDAQLFQLSSEMGPRATLEDAIQRYLALSGLGGDLRRRTEAVLRYVNESGFAAAAGDISLAALFDFPSNPNPYGGQDVFPTGGYQALLEPLAAGVDVRLEHRVTRVETGPEGVVVHARAKTGRRRRTREFRGSHVLVTLPLGVLKARAVEFAPLLPIPKVRAIQRMGVGYLEKISLGFDEPFWRNGGKTHLFYGSATSGEFPAFLDLEQFSGGPVLQGFVAGDFGRRMSRMPRREIRARVLEILREVYGAAVPEPRETLITRWFSDPYTHGSYSSLPVGSTYRDMETLAAPVAGRLLFAGEATHTFRSATADGAFSSGVREAKRLLGASSVRLRPLTRTASSAPVPGEFRARLDRWRRRPVG